MKIKARIDRDRVLYHLEQLGQERQLNFILSRTLNLLAKEVQAEERKGFDLTLKTQRRMPWIKSQVKIKEWSTKRNLTVRIFLDEKANFIGDMEEGAERVPVNGRKYLAYPNPKVFKDKIITNKNPLKVSNLGLTPSKGGLLKGKERTFLVHSDRGTPLILQRTSKPASTRKRKVKDSGVRLLYTLIKKSSRPKKLHWKNIGKTVVRDMQESIWKQVIEDAMKKAKK